jgi:hypothetical protein
MERPFLFVPHESFARAQYLESIWAMGHTVHGSRQILKAYVRLCNQFQIVLLSGDRKRHQIDSGKRKGRIPEQVPSGHGPKGRHCHSKLFALSSSCRVSTVFCIYYSFSCIYFFLYTLVLYLKKKKEVCHIESGRN